MDRLPALVDDLHFDLLIVANAIWYYLPF